jgi:phosphoglycerol transferase MdoB-like AlkP superfamily enzyme
LQYGNQKVGEFLSRIKKSSLNDTVVVALTGDHSYWIAKGVGLEDEFKRYAVPFYLKVPERIKPKKWNPNNFGSHEDIFPTLYHLTLSEREYVKLGENLLGEEGIALNSSGLAANSAGAFHHNSFWGHTNQKDQILKQIPENEDLKNVRERSRSLIGLTDLYLKQEKARTQSVSKSGQR